MTPEMLLSKIRLLCKEKIVSLDGKIWYGKYILTFQHGKLTHIEKRETIK